MFPVLHHVTAVRAGTSTSRGDFFSFFHVCAEKTSTWYHTKYDMKRSFCLFLGHSTQTDCGSCSVYPKPHHPAKRFFVCVRAYRISPG